MRVLAIDYGEKRMGLAISDFTGTIAQPLEIIANDKQFFINLTKLIDEKRVDKIVVGYPIGMSGQETQKTLEVKTFIQTLKQQVSCDVDQFDERLSSIAAERVLLDADMSRSKRKNVKDAVAASFFLQTYLDRNGVSK